MIIQFYRFSVFALPCGAKAVITMHFFKIKQTGSIQNNPPVLSKQTASVKLLSPNQARNHLFSQTGKTLGRELLQIIIQRIIMRHFIQIPVSRQNMQRINKGPFIEVFLHLPHGMLSTYTFQNCHIS